jgi:hypothetical protein
MRSGVNRADETIMRSAFNRSQNRNAYSASQQSRQTKECAMKMAIAEFPDDVTAEGLKPFQQGHGKLYQKSD